MKNLFSNPVRLVFLLGALHAANYFAFGQAPAIVTLYATNITATGATLRASSPAPVSAQTVQFEWGMTTNYGKAQAGVSQGSALAFDGLDDQVLGGRGQFPSVTNDFTMEFWARPTGSIPLPAEAITGNIYYSGPQRFAVFPDHGQESGYPANHVGAGVSVGTNGVAVVEHTADFVPSVLVYTGGLSGWTHVAVVYSQGQPRLYLNGVLVRTGLASGKVVHPSSNLAGVLSAYNFGRYRGTLDEVRIWSTALNAATLLAWMNSEVAANHPAINQLLVGWQLNEGSGTTAADVSGHGKTGTLGNGPVWVTETPLSGLFSTSLTGLVPSTTYHFRAVATNSFGVSLGQDLTFVTGADENPVPAITTLPATGVTATGGILRASAPVPVPVQAVRFEWGMTTNYGNTLPTPGAAAGYALSFDGVNDQVLGGAGQFPAVTNNFTMEFWAKPTGAIPLTAEAITGNIYYSGPQRFAVFPDHGQESGYPANHVGAGVSVGTNGVAVVEHTSSFVPSVLVYTGSLSGWTHVAVVYSQGQPRLYLNGVLARTGLASGKVAHPSSNLAGVLSSYNFGRYRGTLDEVRIWSTALDAVTLQAWMNSEVAANHPAFNQLLVGWHLNEGSGTNTADASGHGKTGVLANGPVWIADTALLGLYAANLTDLTPSTTYHFRAVASNSWGNVYGTDQLFTTLTGQPTIINQPTDATVLVGGNVTFSVTAGGVPPLQYEWSLNGNLIVGATASDLALTNVRPSYAGSYAVRVFNSYGSIGSSNALLTVQFPPAVVAIGSTNATSGATVSIPVSLVANGNENALGFSLNLGSQPGQLGFQGVEPGGVAGNITVVVNTNQLPQGRVGVAVSLPPGETFAAGTQFLVRVNLATPLLIGGSATVIPVNFADAPILRQLIDAEAHILPTTYLGGTISLTPSALEADITPRPAGDYSVTIADWVQVGRFVVGLDTAAQGGEFQRADCAPRSGGGNGELGVTDWVQAGRYAAGLDPLAGAAGPGGKVAARKGSLGSKSLFRILRVSDASILAGRTASVNVEIDSQGDENAVGFSLAFDSSALRLAAVSVAADAAAGVLTLNTNNAASGQLGLALALPVGQSFVAGKRTLVTMQFASLESSTGRFPIAFGNQTTACEVSDVLANELAATYLPGSVTIHPWPTLEISKSNDLLNFSWPIWAGGFVLQSTEGLPGGWNNILLPGQTNGNSVSVSLPVPVSSRFYRLVLP